MEALLPSEIARLVLGYLEDQKCPEAAKLFLETSPHLQECRTVLSFGKRFSTKVNGLTLMDIVEKFSAINTMIQERLNKVTDCGQLKHCGDLMEQLKFLVEEPRGQRFVVNINVPSQSNTQTSNGSPVTASNMRKRRHSNSERIKRTIKSQLITVQQPDSITSPPASYHNVDATPLESLPGNTDLLKQMESNSSIEKKDDNVTQELHNQCYFDKNNSINSNAEYERNNSIQKNLDESCNIRNCEIDIDDKRKEEKSVTCVTLPKLRCTTATNTEELLSFSSAEVQTVPYEMPESESESNDEPIENLSILTKEILNRTEIQECIAENINRAIIPTDLSLKDESLNGSVGGEGNTSFMTEINNAIIKSIVEATETDPVFQELLDEIIGPHTETDTSPEEDGEGKPSPKSLNEVQEKQAETGLSNISSPEPTITDTRASVENGMLDVPLKHRLRSSSRQQNNRTEDEVEKVRGDQEKEQSALDDQNAAAILSIINANIINNMSSDKRILDDAKGSSITSDNKGQKAQTVCTTVNKDDVTLKPLVSTDIQKMSNVASSANSNAEPKVKKSAVKRLRLTKSKRDQMNNDQPITEQEIMTMPTLVVCSKEEINNLLTINSSTSISRFIPIAPKDPNRIEGSVETVYLRAVNVPQKVPAVVALPNVAKEASNTNNMVNKTSVQSREKNARASKKLKAAHSEADATASVSANQRVLDPLEPIQTGKVVGGESITLYGNESNAKTSLDSANMPTINLEENISLSESGLSPYLKFNCSKIGQNHNLSDIDIASVMESVNNNIVGEQQTTTSKSVDIIIKRTPKSLLKSRSKKKLSLSTPRRRNSHVRALDFSTPPKGIRSARKASGSGTAQFSSASMKRLKSVCRTSLFKSPSFSNVSTTMSMQKPKSPMKVCQSYKIPIATRSPAPKLMGGWDKYNGVGVIIGDVSPHESNSASSSSEDKIPCKTSDGAKAVPAVSWDADLRKSIKLHEKEEAEGKKPAKRRNSIKDKNGVICKKDNCNSRSTKGRDKRNTCKTSTELNRDTEDIDEPEEHSQGNANFAMTEKDQHAAAVTEPRKNEKENAAEIATDASDSTTNRPDNNPESADARNKTSLKPDGANVSSDTIVVEKKPVKKYVQLKTIRTNLRNKSDGENKKSTEDAQINSRTSDFSRILSADSTQHILRMPDMLDLETPRKFNNDTSGPPPTPRVLSPSSNVVTPFIRLNEDSGKMHKHISFVSTPEFPPTPCIALTPKHAEETTRDVGKRNEYNSTYYKPTSEQAPQDPDRMANPKGNSFGTHDSPVLSSSHLQLHSSRNSLTPDSTYQTCNSSKLEITQFEVIKENLPKEEAIKELKIASSSSATELNTSVIAIDHRVDLIQINQLKDTCKRGEMPVDDSNVVEHDSSSTSDITSSSGSSSSSSTSTTNTNTSTCSSSVEKRDTTGESIDARASANVVTQNETSPNDAPPIDDARSKESDGPPIRAESSPDKVFAIAKTDEQIKITSKETPAKDETLLNEADISETPSSSKSGVENLTNLSTKISAMITESEKLSKSSKPSKDDDKTIGRSRAKPKIIDVQCIRPTSLKVIELDGDRHQSEHKEDASMCNNLIIQLEEKRQRMIAKFKDIPKANLSSGTKRKRILPGKVNPNTRKKDAQFARQRQNQAAKSSRTSVNQDHNKNAVPRTNLGENSMINRRKRCEQQKRSSPNEYVENNEEDTRKRTSTTTDTDPSSTNYGNNSKPFNDHATKQTHKSTVCNAEDNLVPNYSGESESVQPRRISSFSEEKCTREKLDGKEDVEKSCNGKDDIGAEDNIAGDIDDARPLGDSNDTAYTKAISGKEAKPVEKHIAAQEVSLPDKARQEVQDQVEDRASKPRQFANHADKSKSILKCKVDQVKRDLFSDDENDQRASNVVSASENETRTKQIGQAEMQSPDMSEQAPCTRENVNAESSKQELSTVLQCLQLVPAHKNEQAYNGEDRTERHQERSECKSAIETDNELNRTVNYKAEYHFVYDDSAPIRKRRRRYSAHELQIEINFADLFESDPDESIKVIKATEFEEIFNLPPKPAKRRLTKKVSTRKEKACEMHQSNNDMYILKHDTKPLATSSPLEESAGAKVKKIIKTAATNKIGSEAQSIDASKKKQKLDKAQEKISDVAGKNRKRKLSETKEIKQIEKKPCTTDPQTLLSKVDLEKFLSTVHGPE